MKKIVSVNPANGEMIGEVHALSFDEIKEKVKRARKAASAWKALAAYKSSGMGREHARHGFRELCQIKVIAEA